MEQKELIGILSSDRYVTPLVNAIINDEENANRNEGSNNPNSLNIKPKQEKIKIKQKITELPEQFRKMFDNKGKMKAGDKEFDMQDVLSMLNTAQKFGTIKVDKKYKNTKVDDDNVKYVMYKGTVRSYGQANSKTSVTNQSVNYRLGMRAPSMKKLLKEVKRTLISPIGGSGVIENHSTVMVSRFNYTADLESELTNIAKKYSNFVGKFSVGDLSGVLYVLATSIAFFRCTRKLTVNDIRNGNAQNVVTLATQFQPVTANVSSVFVPRNIANGMFSEAAFAAICAAVNCCGAQVTTDVLQVELSTNATVLPVFTDHVLASGCYEAIRIITAMMDSCNAGALAALAITKGIHNVMTVVGHTDEGGYMRDVLRRNNFGKPFGGIYLRPVEGYTGLPIITVGQMTSWQILVDTIALKTAAAVAVADPCMAHNGTTYPTTFAQETINRSANDVGLSHESNISNHCSEFCLSFINELCNIFCVSGAEQIAQQSLINMFLSYDKKFSSRHVQFGVVNPFYWIEPTSLYKNKKTTVANENGYGVIAGFDQDEEIVNFPNARYKNLGAYTEVITQLPSARLSGLLMHHRNNRKDGLGYIKLIQANADNFVNSKSDDVYSSMLSNKTFEDYIWKTSDSGLIPPGCNLYSGRCMALRINNYECDIESNDITPSEIKQYNELNTNYKFSVGLPSCVGNCAIGNYAAETKRLLTQGAKTLQKIHNRRCAGFILGGQPLEVGNYEPILEGGPIPEQSHNSENVTNDESAPLNNTESSRSSARGLVSRENVNSPTPQTISNSSNRSTINTASGPSLHPVTQNNQGLSSQNEEANAPPAGEQQ